ATPAPAATPAGAESPADRDRQRACSPRPCTVHPFRYPVPWLQTISVRTAASPRRPGRSLPAHPRDDATHNRENMMSFKALILMAAVLWSMPAAADDRG